MSSFRQQLAHRSRDRQFLIRAFFGILAVSLVTSFFVSKLRPRLSSEEMVSMLSTIDLESATPPEREPLRELLEGGERTPEGLAAWVRNAQAYSHHLHQLVGKEMAERTGDDDLHQIAHVGIDYSEALKTTKETELFGLYADALYRDENLGPVAALELHSIATSGGAPPRFANEFYGNWLRTRGEDAKALGFFAAEVAAHPSADFARYQQLRILTKLGRGDELERLMEDPVYDALVDANFRTRIGIETGNWRHLFRSMLSNYYGAVSLPVVIMALVTGIFWFVIITKLGGVTRLRETRLLLCLIAGLLGALSTVATAFVVEWQKHILNFDFTGDFTNDLVYCVSGIGLREELIKLLFLLPLVPFVLRRRSSAEMLLVSACVGLGFGSAENLIHFHETAPYDVVGRLLTANFLHISWTGALGLAFFRMCRWPRTRWEEFLGTFLAVIIVHGIYDALIIVFSRVEDFSPFTVIVIALTAYRYFHLVAETREPFHQLISPLGVFVLGGALIAGLCCNYTALFLDFRDVLRSLIAAFASVGIIGFIYINQLRDE